MKKQTFLFLAITALFFSGLQTVNAQGIFNKIKKKVDEVTKPADPNQPQQPSGNPSTDNGGNTANNNVKPSKDVEADMNDPFLDSQAVTKDKFGLSGVYYSSQPIKVQLKSGKSVMTGKFLLQFDDKQTRLFAKTKYAFGGDAPEPLAWVSESNPADLILRISYSIKQPTLFDIRSGLAAHRFQGTIAEVGDDGKYKQGKRDWQAFTDTDITQIEPGIFMVGSNNYVMLTNRNEKDQTEWNTARMNSFFVFYTADKKEKALAMTQDQLHAAAKKFATEYKARNDKGLDNQDQVNKDIEAAIEKNGGSSTDSSTDSTSNKTPKRNGKIFLSLSNRTNNPIRIEFDTTSGGRTRTTISANSSLSVSMPIGGKVYIKDTKTVLLVVTADMENKKQIIAQ